MSYNANPDTKIYPFVLVTTDLDQALPAKSAVDTKSEIEGIGSDPTTGWAVIGKIEEGVEVSGEEDNSVMTSDGAKLVLSEKITISMEDLNISEYSDLRANLHNTDCQVILVDPNAVGAGDDPNVVPHCKDIKLQVYPNVSDMLKISINGEQTASNLDNIFTIATLS